MTTVIKVAIPPPDIAEQLIFGGKLPKSSAFAEMLENINRVEETPASKRRRLIFTAVMQFSPIFSRIPRIPGPYHSGGFYKPRGRPTGDTIPFPIQKRRGKYDRL